MPQLSADQVTAVVSVVVLLLLRREATRILSAVDKMEVLLVRVERLKERQDSISGAVRGLREQLENTDREVAEQGKQIAILTSQALK